jgi:hypothetical protein
MGAANFRTINTGVNAEAAFDQGVAEAQNEYGCEGYTGTIAEKDGFVLVPLPLNVEAEQVVGALDLSQFDDSYYLTDREEAATAKALLNAHFGESDAARLIELYLNKWGPALCFKLRPPEIVSWNRQRRSTLIPGHDVFLFAGYASE